MHTAEPLAKPIGYEFDIFTEKLKIYKSSGINQIPAELLQAGGNTLCSEIHRLINSLLKKEEQLKQCKESVCVPIYDKTDYSNYREMSLLRNTYKMLPIIPVAMLAPYVDEIIVDHQCAFLSNISTTHLLITYSAFVIHWRKMGVQWDGISFIDSKTAHNLDRREAPYNIHTEFCISET
jgi:hypothetical protein